MMSLDLCECAAPQINEDDYRDRERNRRCRRVAPERERNRIPRKTISTNKINALTTGQNKPASESANDPPKVVGNVRRPNWSGPARMGIGKKSAESTASRISGKNHSTPLVRRKS